MGLRAETAAGTAVGAFVGALVGTFVEMPAGVAPAAALDEAPPGAGAASRSEGFRLVIANKPRSYQ
jgi:hypothetical protein